MFAVCGGGGAAGTVNGYGVRGFRLHMWRSPLCGQLGEPAFCGRFAQYPGWPLLQLQVGERVAE